VCKIGIDALHFGFYSSRKFALDPWVYPFGIDNECVRYDAIRLGFVLLGFCAFGVDSFGAQFCAVWIHDVCVWFLPHGKQLVRLGLHSHWFFFFRTRIRSTGKFAVGLWRFATRIVLVYLGLDSNRQFDEFTFFCEAGKFALGVSNGAIGKFSICSRFLATRELFIFAKSRSTREFDVCLWDESTRILFERFGLWKSRFHVFVARIRKVRERDVRLWRDPSRK
jgi:hypothetical protein